MSVVQFHLWPPQFNQIYQYLTCFIGPLILCTKKVLQGSTSCILGYKPSTKFYISSTKFLHPHHPYGVPPYFVTLRETIPRKILLATSYYKKWGFYLEGVWLWRISRVQSEEIMWMTLRRGVVFDEQFFIQLKLFVLVMVIPSWYSGSIYILTCVWYS